MFPILQHGERSSRRVLFGSRLALTAFTNVLLIAACIAAGVARAQDASDATVTAAARALAVDGVKLAQADRCADAIDKLERAEQLHHSSIVLARLGECYVKLGRLVEGVECLRGVSREALPDKPTDAMREAYATSKTLLEATRNKLATLTISLDVAPNTEAAVTVDDKLVPAALLGAGRPTDPGDHVIMAKAPGYLSSLRRVHLGPGEEQTVVLVLVMDRSAPRTEAHTPADQLSAVPEASVGASATQPTAASLPTPNTDSHLLPAYIAWAASAVALGVGVGFGVAALGDEHQLRERCPSKQCGTDQRDLLDTAHSHATISTIGYLTALGGAAIGGVLFFTGKGSGQPDRDSAPKARVAARIGVASAAVSIAF